MYTHLTADNLFDSQFSLGGAVVPGQLHIMTLNMCNFSAFSCQNWWSLWDSELV